jgi:hypothetical protein
MNPINESLDKYGFQDKEKVLSVILEVLEKYNDYLIDQGYVDSEIYSDIPTAVDRFILSKDHKSYQ